MTISKELLDELLKGCERPEDLLGNDGLKIQHCSKETKTKLGQDQTTQRPPLFPQKAETSAYGYEPARDDIHHDAKITTPSQSVKTLDVYRSVPRCPYHQL
jgi:hypothetical protein